VACAQPQQLLMAQHPLQPNGDDGRHVLAYSSTKAAGFGQFRALSSAGPASFQAETGRAGCGERGPKWNFSVGSAG
jgi:hypothetical protein